MLCDVFFVNVLCFKATCWRSQCWAVIHNWPGWRNFYNSKEQTLRLVIVSFLRLIDPWCSWTWKWNVLHACTAESESTAIGSLKIVKTAIGSLTAIRSQHSTQRLDRWSKQQLDRWPFPFEVASICYLVPFLECIAAATAIAIDSTAQYRIWVLHVASNPRFQFMPRWSWYANEHPEWNAWISKL